jgi:hypothetical protein
MGLRISPLLNPYVPKLSLYQTILAMKTLKEYIISANHQIGYKLMFFIGSIFGVKAAYRASEVSRPLPVQKQEIQHVVINHEVVLEPCANNLDIIPHYYKLTPKMITSLYNLISCSYWDQRTWSNLRDRAFEKDIHSQLGFALREAMSDEVCFPAIN